jgi:hypothetical protein
VRGPEGEQGQARVGGQFHDLEVQVQVTDDGMVEVLEAGSS